MVATHGGGAARGLSPRLGHRQDPRRRPDPAAAVAIMPTGTATPVDGGYRLSGRWPFASGVRHAEWLTAGCRVRRDAQDPGERHIVVFPAAAAEIHDNWQVAGLEGTGSNDFSVTDLFVPADFAWNPATARPRRGGALFRLGMPAFVAYEHVAFALGLDAPGSRRRRGAGGRSGAASTRPRPWPSAPRSRLCSARARSGCAWCAQAQSSSSRPPGSRSCAGDPLTRRQQAELRSVAVHATETAVEIVTGLFRAAGGGALYRTGVLQRCLRDIHAGAQHFMVVRLRVRAPGADPAGRPRRRSDGLVAREARRAGAAGGRARSRGRVSADRRRRSPRLWHVRSPDAPRRCASPRSAPPPPARPAPDCAYRPGDPARPAGRGQRGAERRRPRG